MRLGYVVLLLTSLLSGTAFAADTYSVDPTGGPLTLADEVAAAVLAWTADAKDVMLTEGPDPAAEVRFAASEPAGAGPDTVTLTLQDSNGPIRLTVLVNQALYDKYPAALLHEAGLLLGVSTGGVGVMNPALGSGSPTELTAGDLAGLTQAQSSVPGDLTGDGLVDWYDLLELARSHGKRGVNLPADLDGDGTVTDADVAMLRELHSFLPPAAPGETDPDPTDPAGAQQLPEVPEPVPASGAAVPGQAGPDETVEPLVPEDDAEEVDSEKDG